MTGNVKKQFVAKSVKYIEKFTIVVESELVLHFGDRSFFMREGELVGFGKHHLKIA